jgi:hypothetical protein
MNAKETMLDALHQDYKDIDNAIDGILSARARKATDELISIPKRELKAFVEMERTMVGVQQNISAIAARLRQFDWESIRHIVRIADCLTEDASDNNWTEEQYYSTILEEFLKEEKK